MKNIIIKPIKPFQITVEAECISTDRLCSLNLDQIRSLKIWQGKCEAKLSLLFQVEGDDGPARPEETAIRLEGDFFRVKRIAENMSAGKIEVMGSIGMRAGSGMKGGTLHVFGNADDWLGREMSGGKIIIKGNAGNYAGSGYRGEKCGMRGGEIEISGNAGSYLGEHMCGGSIKVEGNAGDFIGACNQGGTIIVGGSTYLPGAEMTKGSIIIKGGGRMLPSFQRLELVNIEGYPFQKYIGDLVENGKGEVLIAEGRVSMDTLIK